jgi:hypothetical protein
LAGRDGTRILTQVRDLDGRLAWMPVREGATLSDADADAYIRRAVDRDADLWIIEIETRAGENPFEGAIIGT